MTRAVARVTTTALAVLAAALLSLALFAGPALAAEEGDEASGVKGDATGFLYTAIAGVAMGVVVFAMSRPGDIHRADHHDDGAHGGSESQALVEAVGSAEDAPAMGTNSPKGDQQMAP